MSRDPTNNTWVPDICIYHAHCLDGFAAAYAVWATWGDEVTFIPASYGQEPPRSIMGADVLIVDFSYKRPVLDEMAKRAHSIVILDHHKTAAEDLAGISGIPPFVGKQNICWGIPDGPGVYAWFDMEKSGARMAWEFCLLGKPTVIAEHIEDRDLWRFQMNNTKDIAAWLQVQEMDFRLWRTFMNPTDAKYLAMVEQGHLLRIKHDKDVRSLIDATQRRGSVYGYSVPIANVPFFMASDAGNIMSVGEPFAATYFDGADGLRKWSLRSQPDGMDVSEIAKNFGGGGHSHAAGFSLPMNFT